MQKSAEKFLNLQSAIAKSGFSAKELDVMVAMARIGPSTQKEIGPACDCPLTTLPRHMASLRRAGYIERVVDGEDVRKVTFRLSKKGTSITERILRLIA